MNDEFDEPTTEEVEQVQRIFAEEAMRIKELEDLQYDGVNGLPPDWIPAPTIDRFRRIRNCFLEDCGYPHELLKERIRYYRENGVPPFHVHPNDNPIDRPALNLLLGFLSRLEWVVSLGRGRGLKELINIDAADAELGKQRRNEMADFEKRRGTDLKEDAAAKHKTWKDWAEQVRMEDPKRAYSTRALAKIVKSRLNLKESIETIRKRI